MEMTLEGMKRLDELRLNYSHLFVLEYISLTGNIEEIKHSTAYQTLVRKEYVLQNVFTQSGLALLEEFSIERKAIENEEQLFEEWWQNFPSTDTVTNNYGQVIFQLSRALKTAKKQCFLKYKHLLKEYTHEELLNSLKFEVNLKISQSIKEMDNKLKYMKNSLTYLNQKAFEPYIQLSKNIDNNHGIGNETIII